MRLAADRKPRSVMRSLLTITFILTFPLLVYGGQASNACVDFERTIKTTYNFRPCRLRPTPFVA